ncbi:hypothetical protein CLAFUW4_02616 [Fulvia fulva]|uniref:Uncharacterized protein n=1 Tax=Passalora fulva TaxID=5499 RepID=A0A9Q8LB47_PASFU|nr:uncharacterized protein CLAFUR5_02604 [Fulvia fulva]KAK4631287.1 hypothetical protein CLAFUR4_02611 [Fulvia fulva]UJO13508.1 hypothetical protein CLAFUR5_02604 [Fulvia fulva]WPV11594.1 hypothetical protein CLAFUW4_02616 [Fulvia fulva]WPV25991.1 hypothetical protein CLAFUW7_02616 [Fulvia fulva]
MPTIHELHTLLSQAERTIQARANDLADAQEHQEQVARDCSRDKYDKKWSQAKNATQRAQRRYERALRETEKLERSIRNTPPSRDHTSKARSTPLPDTGPAQGTLFHLEIEHWREQCVDCCTNYPALRAFPVPPIRRPCMKQACRKETRALAVCKCQIQHAFHRVPDLNLKKERIAWHPDKFAACLQRKDEFQGMAKEIFVVVDEMYRRTQV